MPSKSPVLSGPSVSLHAFPPALKAYLENPTAAPLAGNQGDSVMTWNQIRSNPVFVTVSSAAAGAVVKMLQDELTRGGLDLSATGLRRMGILIVTVVVTALVHLYTPVPPAATTPVAASGSKLGVWMLIALLVSSPFSAGCGGATVAQDIVNWTPALQSAVSAVDATAAVLDPVSAPIFTAATAGFDAASNELVTQAKAYLLTPTATVLARLQVAVVTFQQTIDAAMLKAVDIGNTVALRKAQADISGVAAIVNIILGLVVSISSKPAVAKMAAAAPFKIDYVDKDGTGQPLIVRFISAHYGISDAAAREMSSTGRQRLLQAGF
jgi:hypothetical protein